jgi:hypothetical protein
MWGTVAAMLPVRDGRFARKHTVAGVIGKTAERLEVGSACCGFRARLRCLQVLLPCFVNRAHERLFVSLKRGERLRFWCHLHAQYHGYSGTKSR